MATRAAAANAVLPLSGLCFEPRAADRLKARGIAVFGADLCPATGTDDAQHEHRFCSSG